MVGDGEYYDALGAPEIFVNEIAYIEMAGPGIVRFGMAALEGCPANRIIRVKLLMLTALIPDAIIRASEFMASQGTRKLLRPDTRLVM